MLVVRYVIIQGYVRRSYVINLVEDNVEDLFNSFY